MSRLVSQEEEAGPAGRANAEPRAAAADPEGGTALRLELRPSLDGVDPSAWDPLVGDDDPFAEHAFLAALEHSAVVGRGTSWQPRHMTAWRGDRLVGAIPFYIRWDSYGEYIFDFGWAEAYARAGLRYYPKGVAAIPFTPVTGTRILLAPGEALEGTGAAMVDGLRRAAATLELSGVHVLFCRQGEAEALGGAGFGTRLTHQYHWENRGYSTFEDFLADLRSKKRKQVLAERAEVRAQGLRVEVLEGDQLRPEHVDAVWRFYLSTASSKWSQPYLVRETFEELASTWKDRILVVLAREGDRYVGGTFNARGSRTVFGRYWGSTGHYPSLHFECCYWSLIEYAIERGMGRVEAGAQGEHKFLRGYAARPTWSAHWIAHPGGAAAIADFLEREREHAEAVIEGYNRVSPVKSERGRS